MKLYAISDLHIGHSINRAALEQMPTFVDDWLLLAGDVGETAEHLEYALSLLTRRFARIIWTPGNHDLWSLPAAPDGLRGEAKYQQLVAICRRYDVLTPEDPYVRWPGPDFEATLAPTFVLYDYSFRPDHVQAGDALAWAEASGVVCADEALLHPDPYPSRAAWCAARCTYTEARLSAASQNGPLLLINHFPLRQDLAILPRIPRFSLWCGTRTTESWLQRFPIAGVVYGHLHIRGKRQVEGVCHLEVSLGYPRDWDQRRGIAYYLREIEIGFD